MSEAHLESLDRLEQPWERVLLRDAMEQAECVVQPLARAWEQLERARARAIVTHRVLRGQVTLDAVEVLELVLDRLGVHHLDEARLECGLVVERKAPRTVPRRG